MGLGKVWDKIWVLEVVNWKSIILFTHWLAKAWKDYTTNCQEQITNAFKRCGQYNDINGRENHLVKIQGVPDYKPPAKTDPWLVDPLKEGKKKRKKPQPKRKKSQAKRKSKKRKISWVSNFIQFVLYYMQFFNLITYQWFTRSMKSISSKTHEKYQFQDPWKLPVPRPFKITCSKTHAKYHFQDPWKLPIPRPFKITCSKTHEKSVPRPMNIIGLKNVQIQKPVPRPPVGPFENPWFFSWVLDPALPCTWNYTRNNG